MKGLLSYLPLWILKIFPDAMTVDSYESKKAGRYHYVLLTMDAYLLYAMVE